MSVPSALIRVPVVVALASLQAVPAATRAAAQQPAQRPLELTVYNEDLALVKERREVELSTGVSTVEYRDVAASMDPTSVSFRSVRDPEGTAVLEQNFEYDLVDSSRLLEKYVDQRIEVVLSEGERLSGTLLSSRDGVILRLEDGSVFSAREGEVRSFRFPALPAGLRTRPTLVWTVRAAKGGAHLTELSYLTSGMSWQADYVLQLSDDERRMDLNGWVTLENRSGATYEDARLKLVAGEIHRAPDAAAREVRLEAARVRAEPDVRQREFFEYHLYEVGRPVTVKDRQTKQVEFVTADGVTVRKFFVYDGSPSARPWGGPLTSASYGAETGVKDVRVMLEFRTDAQSGLETQLPAGRVRVYKRDVDGSALLVGEDRVDHTPVDETVRITMGNAFDVVGKRTRTDFVVDGEHALEEGYRIRLRNHKEEPVEVRVVERLFRWSEWEILRETVDGEGAEHRKLDARTVEWRLPVPSGGETELEYRVRYEWE